MLCSPQAQTQTAGSNLVIPRQLGHQLRRGRGGNTRSESIQKVPETIIVTRNLSRWQRTAFETVLAANAVYDVILTTSDGTQLVKFPVTTVMINPSDLQRAGIALVFNELEQDPQIGKRKCGYELLSRRIDRYRSASALWQLCNSRLRGNRPKSRRKVPQERRLVRNFQSPDFAAPAPHLEDHFHHVVDVALRVDPPRDRQPHQVHRGVLRRTSASRSPPSGCRPPGKAPRPAPRPETARAGYAAESAARRCRSHARPAAA